MCKSVCVAVCLLNDPLTHSASGDSAWGEGIGAASWDGAGFVYLSRALCQLIDHYKITGSKGSIQREAEISYSLLG